MRSVHRIAELRQILSDHRRSHRTGGALRQHPSRPSASEPQPRDRGGIGAGRYAVALVPTMGYLHEGHLSLVDEARALADLVVMSVFVNPLQFGPGEDLEQYPRDLERDAALAESRGVDVLFVPDAGEMYPAGEPRVRVVPGPLGDRLCGRFRPGHFEGVLTVVAKLLNIVEPDVAVFGRKDFQQAVLIQQMVRDLDIPVEIRTVPTVRAADGLALSSRNEYLSPAQREAATSLYRGLSGAVQAFRAGERSAERLCARVADTVNRAPEARVQYVELVDPETLDPLDVAERGAVLAVAAFVGSTRLIDNVTLE